MAHVADVVVQSSQVTADLTDFPLLVDLSDLPAGFWSTVANGGGDIRVYKSDGTTELAREVVSCDTVTDTGELWIKFAGTLSSSVNTTIQIHADGSSADYAVGATYGRNAVWSGFKGVFHLAETPTGVAGDIKNSTGLGDGTSVNMGAANSVSPLFGSGSALDFNGTDEGIDIGDVDWVDSGNTLSLTSWYRIDNLASASGGLISKWSETFSDRTFIWQGDPSPTDEMRFAASPASTDLLVRDSTNANQATGIIYSGGVVWSGGTAVAMYKNGAALTVSSVVSNTVSMTNTATGVKIAYRPGGFYYDGAIQEVRLSRSALSANWITTEYNNQNSPSTFYTVTAIGGTTITADGVVQQQTIGEVTLTQSHVLQPDSLYQSQGLEAVTLTQAHTLTPDAISQTQGLEAATLTQAHIIAPDGLYQAQAMEQAALTQAHSLTPDGLAQDQVTGSPALTQAHVLTPDGLAQAQGLNQVTLAVAGSLLIDSLSQTTGLTVVELVQAGVLSVDPISQEQSLATITLTQDHQLTPDGLSQTQGVEQAVLSVLNVLSIDSLAQAQGLAPATLTQAHVLAVDDLTQEQIIQAISFGGVVVGSLKGSIRIYALLDGAIDIKPALKGNITIH